jgi:uncharacterized protein
MSRVFDGERLWRLDQPTCEVACRRIAATVARRFAPFHAVVAVARGGCVPASTVADALSLPVVTVRAQHNPSDAVRSLATGRVQIVAPDLGTLPERPRLLVVDDICGTGATLDTVAGMLRSLVRPSGLRTAALCRNVGSKLRPDLWVWDVRDWVAFPWEPPPGESADALPPPAYVRFGR